jgi:hypothetical protein
LNHDPLRPRRNAVTRARATADRGFALHLTKTSLDYTKPAPTLRTARSPSHPSKRNLFPDNILRAYFHRPGLSRTSFLPRNTAIHAIQKEKRNILCRFGV